ncbi:hypothetical protein A3F03_02125 [Candidatus Roizmanbacteria bacterium RIFCSPHIGHO2_12_FULL_41_11]|uniref:IMP dehydrogenase/GMP reductase domain-containing protein n=1 Tax=Candidatus Roizmanbacteria bacterium RIFCSPHIGHO2_12_FULL_41_11 TaxID=1802052 RepID=A0A1F7I512_9BACT|nr:MAG: hypothetical protein A3F03_02125 [Candidatus Roizmanbacteria bacterium RIFCSPHIGHO2_12_FULL_41_11]
MNNKVIFNQGLTFDDVLLLPDYSDFSRTEIDLSSQLTRHIKLKLPLVSAPMDTVTESLLAISLGKLGGIGIIHRNLMIADQVNEIQKVKQQKLTVGAAIGASRDNTDRIKALAEAKTDVIVVDSAHGYAKNVIDTIRFIKKNYPNIDVIGGNVATYEGAKALIKAGVDGLRVGMGPGAICTTRVISGMGVPQITALIETCRAGAMAKIPVMADGGIKFSGDIVKALAAGAATVMMGNFFASAQEAPGQILELTAQEVPSRFKSIVNTNQKYYKFKSYRGMGSVGAMQKGVSVKSEDEFHGKNYQDRVLVAEGVEGLVPIKGSVKSLVDQAIGGIKSGLYYVGAKTIEELQKKAKFMQITQASLTESHPHDILITNPGMNYQ